MYFGAAITKLAGVWELFPFLPPQPLLSDRKRTKCSLQHPRRRDWLPPTPSLTLIRPGSQGRREEKACGSEHGGGPPNSPQADTPAPLTLDGKWLLVDSFSLGCQGCALSLTPGILYKNDWPTPPGLSMGYIRSAILESVHPVGLGEVFVLFLTHSSQTPLSISWPSPCKQISECFSGQSQTPLLHVHTICWALKQWVLPELRDPVVL